VASTARDIKAAIVTLIETVSGLAAATVHPYARHAPKQGATSTFDTDFISSSKVNTWDVGGPMRVDSQWSALNKAWDRRDTYQIRGWYELDDANDSEATFAGYIEDVLEAINGDHTLGGTVTTHGTAQVVSYGIEEKAGRLSHVVVMTLAATWTHQP
jgi:hypothetical protein